MWVFALLFLNSCDEDDDIVIDYVPVEFTISVQNPAGSNLLDASVPGNVLDESISITYKGQDYDMAVWDGSRLLPPYWYGLVLQNNAGSVPRLHVGQFDGVSRHEVYVLKIGSREYDISFDAKFKSGGDVSRTFYLNGKKQKVDEVKPAYTIVINK